MVLPIFAFISTLFFSLFLKGVFLITWPYLDILLSMKLYAYKSYPSVCGTLSGVKLQISEAYIFVWLEHGEGRHFKKEFELSHKACEVPFPSVEAALFWPGMAHARVFEKRTGFMGLRLTPSLVREQDAAAWIEQMTRASEINQTQREHFDSSLNLFYALDAKSSLGNHRKEMYWAAPGSTEQVVIECEFIKQRAPVSCVQRWVNDGVGSIVSVAYETTYKQHWKQIKMDVDNFIEDLKIKD